VRRLAVPCGAARRRTVRAAGTISGVIEPLIDTWQPKVIANIDNAYWTREK